MHGCRSMQDATFRTVPRWGIHRGRSRYQKSSIQDGPRLSRHVQRAI